MQNQMLRAIPFGKHQKISAVISGDAMFLLFLVCFSDLDIFCSGSFSHLVKFYRFIFMQKISTREVSVNGRHPRSLKKQTNTQVSVIQSNKKNAKQEKNILRLDQKNPFCITTTFTSFKIFPQFFEFP